MNDAPTSSKTGAAIKTRMSNSYRNQAMPPNYYPYAYQFSLIEMYAFIEEHIRGDAYAL